MTIDPNKFLWQLNSIGKVGFSAFLVNFYKICKVLPFLMVSDLSDFAFWEQSEK